ncbi:mismatched base pair and cruciform DNA recognition protein [Dendrothele bispora CBS 962.96]|uniref:Mismatched base pair and cruciform DNA recognition protein n=1 Tax=Dendrothele bispora (strain CBS 962.96) TaxID=1314807 RepID=A0A4S8MQN1_DENBC|nr:mismatched base pair and cruciform DNA recognition protein [Dendrothele bispora CBS 962.96]
MSGQFHSVKGNIVEGLGNLTGVKSWQQSGKEEHAAGEAELNAAKAKGYAEGTKDRAGGYMQNVAGAVTGDKEQQARGNVRNEHGQAQQEINRPT